LATPFTSFLTVRSVSIAPTRDRRALPSPICAVSAAASFRREKACDRPANRRTIAVFVTVCAGDVTSQCIAGHSWRAYFASFRMHCDPTCAPPRSISPSPSSPCLRVRSRTPGDARSPLSPPRGGAWGGPGRVEARVRDAPSRRCRRKATRPRAQPTVKRRHAACRRVPAGPAQRDGRGGD
jgi:hypothetical protein